MADAGPSVDAAARTPFEAAEYAVRRAFLLYTQFVDEYHSHALVRAALSASRGWVEASWCKGESGRLYRRGSRGADRRSDRERGATNECAREAAGIQSVQVRRSALSHRAPRRHEALRARRLQPRWLRLRGRRKAARWRRHLKVPQCARRRRHRKVYCGAWARPNGWLGARLHSRAVWT
jgi:hypothetical protein